MPQIGEYKSLSDSNEAIPPGVDEIIRRCLAQDRLVRHASAKDFITALRDVFRTNVPLSTLLTDARLHELHAALQGMSPDEFAGKPKGQKLLIIRRVKDLIRTDSPPMRRPTAEMIALLVRLALYEPSDEYSTIVNAAFEWGYEKAFSSTWSGDDSIRSALVVASKDASRDALKIISQGLIGFAQGQNLEAKSRWYLHDLRLNVMALLANQYCEEHAKELAELYDKINAISHNTASTQIGLIT